MDKKFTPRPLLEASRRLRKTATPAEQKLWEALRGHQLKGAKFKRQHVIQQYIVDFYCHTACLIIELDGSIHDNPDVQARDQDRQQQLEALGYHVLRFRNEDILQNLANVLEQIGAKLPSPPTRCASHRCARARGVSIPLPPFGVRG